MPGRGESLLPASRPQAHPSDPRGSRGIEEPCRLGRGSFSCRRRCRVMPGWSSRGSLVEVFVTEEAHNLGEKEIPRDAVVYAVVELVEAGLEFGIVLLPKFLPKLVHSELSPKAQDVHGAIVVDYPQTPRGHWRQLAGVPNSDHSPTRKARAACAVVPLAAGQDP